MIPEAREVRVIGDARIWVKFEDGASGEVDVALHVPFDGVFEPLRDPAYFARVGIHSDLGTICWPSGADIDPAVLYSWATGAPLPGFAAEAASVRIAGP